MDEQPLVGQSMIGPGVIGPGASGPAVTQIIELLSTLGLLDSHTPPPSYDDRVELAVRTFQQQRGLRVDGIVGTETFRRLDEARWRLGDRILVHRPGRLLVGDDVVALQQRLLELGFNLGRADGYFGARTEDALRDFQRNVGIPPDGTCGPATFKALSRLAPLVRGGEPNALRASERIRNAGPALAGKTVVIDPAPARGVSAELAEIVDAVILDLARRIEGRLGAIGVQAFLTHTGRVDEESSRAQFANRERADLCVSLAMDASASSEASGVASYHFGDIHGTVSTTGKRLASLTQREVAARTDLADLRTHAKSWDLLRRTTMPAVRIDVGYATNAGDLARMRDPAFRDVVAEGIVVAVQRFYLSPELDAETGVLTLSELRAALLRRSDGGGGRPDLPA